MKKLSFLILMLFLALNIFGYNWSAPSIVDASASTGKFASLTVDNGGNSHLSYYDQINGVLKYAFKDTDIWSVTIVDNSAFVGKYSSIATDSSDRPHISYFDETNGLLKYAHFDGNSWNTEYVDQSSSVGRYSSIEIASDNTVFISYYDQFNTALKMASGTTGNFTAEWVDQALGTGRYSSLCLDGVELPCIAYYDQTNLRMKFAQKSTSGDWSITSDVDSNVDVAKGISLSSAGNEFLISYYDGQQKDLKAAYYNGTLWTIYTVDSSVETVGLYCSSFLGPGSDRYISYVSTTDSKVKFASWNAGAWSSEIIADSAAESTCMTVGVNGNPQVAYFNIGQGRLNFTEDVTNHAPELHAPDISASVATPNDTVIYSVEYTDIDNDAPAAGFPSLHILNGGSEIPGSPFTMSSGGAPDYYWRGNTYYYSIQLSSGSDYSYYFKAEDISAANTFTDEISGPVITHAPVLEWSGSAGFVTDGVDPFMASTYETYTFKVVYSDEDNDPPFSGFPTLRIFSESGEIDTSPYTMTGISGDPLTGETFSLTVDLIPGNYTYSFEAQDQWGIYATGAPAGSNTGPFVVNYPPVLAWTGEANYVGTGVYPHSGGVSDTFTFRIKYADMENEAPCPGDPRVHILEDGIEIDSSPISMEYDSGDTYSAAIYSVSTLLPPGDFTYTISAGDKWCAEAETAEKSDLIVTNENPVLSWTGETGYISDGVDPDAADILTPYEFRIKYTDAEDEHPMEGYPRVIVWNYGLEYPDSPYEMSLSTGTYSAGAVYSVEILLSRGDEHEYLFEARDKWGQAALGDTGPIGVSQGPVVYTTALEDLEHLTIYPNPADQYTVVENLTSSGKIKLYDISGNMVAEKEYYPEDAGQYTLDLTDYASGIYILHIEDSQGEMKRNGKVAVIRE